jgi:hypothetical protein
MLFPMPRSQTGWLAAGPLEDISAMQKNGVIFETHNAVGEFAACDISANFGCLTHQTTQVHSGCLANP